MLTEEQRDALEWAASRAEYFASETDKESPLNRRLRVLRNMLSASTQPMTDAARDVLTRWRSARTEPPKMDAPPHYSITVLGVVDDPRYHNNDDDHAFVDVVGYWPALNKWTVTHSCVRDDTAEDVEVKVTWWMPLPEAPVSRTYRLAEIERIERENEK